MFELIALLSIAVALVTVICACMLSSQISESEAKDDEWN